MNIDYDSPIYEDDFAEDVENTEDLFSKYEKRKQIPNDFLENKRNIIEDDYNILKYSQQHD